MIRIFGRLPAFIDIIIIISLKSEEFNKISKSSLNILCLGIALKLKMAAIISNHHCFLLLFLTHYKGRSCHIFRFFIGKRVANHKKNTWDNESY